MDKQPIGVIPKELHDKMITQDRFVAIQGAIYRYLEAGLQIDTEWIEEYNELITKLKIK